MWMVPGDVLGRHTRLLMDDGTVWDAAAQKVAWTFDGSLTAVAVDAEHLYLGMADGQVEIRSLNGELSARLRAHDELVSSLVPEGNDLYTASWDAVVRRFDLAGL